MPEIASLQLFKILSDETRLGIVLLLREMGELCVCDLCTALEQSQPKTSRHLAMLRESGLDDVQAIARKLASANCSGSGKAVCI